MHIAFITPEYPHEKVKHAAGIGTSIKNLVTALVDKGETVTVFVYGQQQSEIFQEDGVSIHLIENKSYGFGKWYFYRKYIEKYVNKVAKENKIALIEAPDWTGITAFMNFKIPLIIRFHGSDTYFCHLENRKQKLKNYWFEKLAIRNAYGFIAPTDFAGNLSKELFGIKNKSIKTIFNGIELNKFQNETPDNYQKGLLLYIGTIIRKKGVLELPELFHKVREKFNEATLVIIGNDSPDIQTGNTSTWELVASKFHQEDKPFVNYLGKIPYQDIQSYIKKAHVCVFPTFAETFGMVTVESMAMSKPVVNSNIGWAQELMENGKSGFLIHPSNHEEYAQAILKFLTDQELTKQTGIEARKYVQSKFDIEKIADENVKFYKQVVQDAHRLS